jgi:EamA domain-containing membrane protein RarD
MPAESRWGWIVCFMDYLATILEMLVVIMRNVYACFMNLLILIFRRISVEIPTSIRT